MAELALAALFAADACVVSGVVARADQLAVAWDVQLRRHVSTDAGSPPGEARRRRRVRGSTDGGSRRASDEPAARMAAAAAAGGVPAVSPRLPTAASGLPAAARLRAGRV